MLGKSKYTRQKKSKYTRQKNQNTRVRKIKTRASQRNQNTCVRKSKYTRWKNQNAKRIISYVSYRCTARTAGAQSRSRSHVSLFCPFPRPDQNEPPQTTNPTLPRSAIILVSTPMYPDVLTVASVRSIPSLRLQALLWAHYMLSASACSSLYLLYPTARMMAHLLVVSAANQMGTRSGDGTRFVR